jgi:uncharacterized protein YaaN involved in tellurite resistance
MSEKKTDKGKAAKKLHGLQKRMTRMEENEGHALEKLGKRKGMLKKLKDKLMGTFKRKDYYSDDE